MLSLSLLPMLVTLTPPVKLTPHRLSCRTVACRYTYIRSALYSPGSCRGTVHVKGSALRNYFGLKFRSIRIMRA